MRTKIEYFWSISGTGLCTKINEFSESHEVIATQTHLDGSNFSAFVYYKEDSK